MPAYAFIFFNDGIYVKVWQMLSYSHRNERFCIKRRLSVMNYSGARSREVHVLLGRHADLGMTPASVNNFPITTMHKVTRIFPPLLVWIFSHLLQPQPGWPAHPTCECRNEFHFLTYQTPIRVVWGCWDWIVKQLASSTPTDKHLNVLNGLSFNCPCPRWDDSPPSVAFYDNEVLLTTSDVLQRKHTATQRR